MRPQGSQPMHVHVHSSQLRKQKPLLAENSGKILLINCILASTLQRRRWSCFGVSSVRWCFTRTHAHPGWAHAAPCPAPSHCILWAFSRVTVSCLLSPTLRARNKHPANACYAVCFGSLTTVRRLRLACSCRTLETPVCPLGTQSWDQESRVMGEGRPAALGVPQEAKGRPLTDLPPLLPQLGRAASTSIVAHHASFYLSSESRGCQRSHGGPGGKDFRFRATWFLLKHLNAACQRESSQRGATRQRACPCPNKALLTITAWGPDHTCRPRLPDPGLDNRKSAGAF